MTRTEAAGGHEEEDELELDEEEEEEEKDELELDDEEDEEELELDEDEAFDESTKRAEYEAAIGAARVVIVCRAA